jgi:molybdate transport system ATP-binding protein
MSLHVLLRHQFTTVRMDLEFDVPTPGVTILFGASGSGKSTIINAAAGLLRPDECSVVLDGQVLSDTASGAWLSPERRRIGLVFQDARLFPHMSVATNLRFGSHTHCPAANVSVLPSAAPFWLNRICC